MKKICICGGGSLGHVIAGWLSSKNKACVNLLTGHPENWNNNLVIKTIDNQVLHGHIDDISSNPSNVVSNSDVILLCLPGFLIEKTLVEIKPYIKENACVGSVFSSTGFFFEAIKHLSDKQRLWGFQRVPFIARVDSYGHSVNLLGYKNSLFLGLKNFESANEEENFREWISTCFEKPTSLLSNYLEASLTNSNPLLHTSRLYSLFGGKNEGKLYSKNILFYEEWDEASAQLLIDMDQEFFQLLGKLPVTKGFLPTILDYYESHDAQSLAAKLSSIKGFKGITSPMFQSGDFWVPDYSSRYFTEDFPFGLKYIWQLAHDNDVEVPNIDLVYNWGLKKIS